MICLSPIGKQHNASCGKKWTVGRNGSQPWVGHVIRMRNLRVRLVNSNWRSWLFVRVPSFPNPFRRRHGDQSRVWSCRLDRRCWSTRLRLKENELKNVCGYFLLERFPNEKG